MYVYGYGSKNGYGSFHVDPDVWNEWATYKSQEVWSGPTEKIYWSGLAKVRIKGTDHVH